MHRGYIKLWRKSIDSRIFKNEKLWKVWTWCLLKASHKRQWVTMNSGKIEIEIEISPGQFVFGRESAAKELRMPQSSVRNRMEKLKKTQNLAIKPDRQYSIISIMNWESYQCEENKVDSNVDSQRTAKGQPKDTYKNDKNVKNDKNKDICLEPKIDSSQIFISIPLVNKNNGVPIEYPILKSKVVEWKDSYPGIDVEQELRKVRQWNKDNSTRRKTKTGILRHINSWLGRAQDKAGNNQSHGYDDNFDQPPIEDLIS